MCALCGAVRGHPSHPLRGSSPPGRAFFTPLLCDKSFRSTKIDLVGEGSPLPKKTTNSTHAGGETPPLQGILLFFQQNRRCPPRPWILHEVSWRLNKPSSGRKGDHEVVEGARVQNKICANSNIARAPSPPTAELPPGGSLLLCHRYKKYGKNPSQHQN